MESTMVTMIDDNSDNECNADNNGDNGDDHNGNDNKATMTRPQQQDHDNKTMMRYNNQLNGGPSAVDCNDDDDKDGNSNGCGKGDGDGKGNGGSTHCNNNNDNKNNNPLPVIVNDVVIQCLCLCRAVTMMVAAGWQGGSCHWQGGDGNSNSACCNDDNINHDNNHPLPVIADNFVIGCLSLCGARSTMVVGRQQCSGCQQGGEDSSRQGQT
jgi:hypothetical protein